MASCGRGELAEASLNRLISDDNNFQVISGDFEVQVNCQLKSWRSSLRLGSNSKKKDLNPRTGWKPEQAAILARVKSVNKAESPGRMIAYSQRKFFSMSTLRHRVYAQTIPQMKNKIILVYKQTKNLKVLRMRKFLKETRSTNLQLKSIAVLMQPIFCFNQNLDVRRRH